MTLQLNCVVMWFSISDFVLMMPVYHISCYLFLNIYVINCNLNVKKKKKSDVSVTMNFKHHI